jgi:WhiB family transcriptional regulator, redox-sensing transcriptional regulator
MTRTASTQREAEMTITTQQTAWTGRPRTGQNPADPDGTTTMEVTPMQLTTAPEPMLGQRSGHGTIPCRAYDAELWFAESPADVELAKSLCTGCPVRTECLAGALERHEPWGVWGGQLLVQGAIVARKRPRGRPRKCEAAA